MATKKTAKKLPIGTGKIDLRVSNTYRVSKAKLWEAITQSKHTSKYFVDRVTGDFTAKLTPVEWYWKKWGAHTQQPTAYQKEKKLVFMWPNHGNKYYTTVTFSLKTVGKLTELEIHEKGWKQADMKNAFANCEGWTTFLCYLKAYVQNKVILQSR